MRELQSEEREVEAQASMYVIQLKRRSFVKGQVWTDKFVILCYFCIVKYMKYVMVECVYLTTQYFQIYLCKCLLPLQLSERTRTHKFITV